MLNKYDNNQIVEFKLLNKLENEKFNKIVKNNLLPEHNMAKNSESNKIIDNINFSAENNLMQKTQSYRSPSISEIMIVCCKYSCSIRDLLPYCSPFEF